MLGAKVLICGIERLHDYLERSFLPDRTFISPLASTLSFKRGWESPTDDRSGPWAGPPADRIGVDRAAMLTLPPVPPVTGWEMSAAAAS